MCKCQRFFHFLHIASSLISIVVKYIQIGYIACQNVKIELHFIVAIRCGTVFSLENNRPIKRVLSVVI